MNSAIIYLILMIYRIRDQKLCTKWIKYSLDGYTRIELNSHVSYSTEKVVSIK